MKLKIKNVPIEEGFKDSVKKGLTGLALAGTLAGSNPNAGQKVGFKDRVMQNYKRRSENLVDLRDTETKISYQNDIKKQKLLKKFATRIETVKEVQKERIMQLMDLIQRIVENNKERNDKIKIRDIWTDKFSYRRNLPYELDAINNLEEYLQKEDLIKLDEYYFYLTNGRGTGKLKYNPYMENIEKFFSILQDQIHRLNILKKRPQISNELESDKVYYEDE